VLFFNTCSSVGAVLLMVKLLCKHTGGWHTAIQADNQLGAIDYDDLEGNAQRRLAGLKREADRQAEIRCRTKREIKVIQALIITFYK